MARRTLASTFALALTLTLVLACKPAPPKHLTIAVEGMTCNSCVKAITAALSQLPGVTKAEVKLEAGRAYVTYAPGKVSTETLLKTITKLGYKARALAPGSSPAKAP